MRVANRLLATTFVALSLTAATAVAHADDTALTREANDALTHKDYATAFSRFSVLAQHGNPTAQFNLGVFYYNGQGVAKDERQAFDWFAKSAAQGNTSALQFLQGAAARGNENAKNALGRMQQPASMPPQTRTLPPEASPPSVDDKTLLTEAANALNRRDYATAFSRFLILAQHGDALAQFNVGAFYYNGQGVAKDERLAYEWLARSAAQGNTRALEIVRSAAARGNENAKRAYARLTSAAPQSAPQSPAQNKPAIASAPATPANSAPSQDPPPSGLSLGVNLGGTGRLSGINNSSSFGVLLGYSFNESFGVELAYNALYRNANADQFIAATNPGSTGSFDLSAISVTGQYTYPLGDNWSLKGNLGAHSSSFKVSSATTGSITGHSSGLVVGLKAQYDLSKSVGIRAGFDTYKQGGGISGATSQVGLSVILGF